MVSPVLKKGRNKLNKGYFVGYVSVNFGVQIAKMASRAPQFLTLFGERTYKAPPVEVFPSIPHCHTLILCPKEA